MYLDSFHNSHLSWEEPVFFPAFIGGLFRHALSQAKAST